jgi:hypothetical protein
MAEAHRSATSTRHGASVARRWAQHDVSPALASAQRRRTASGQRLLACSHERAATLPATTTTIASTLSLHALPASQQQHSSLHTTQALIMSDWGASPRLLPRPPPALTLSHQTPRRSSAATRAAASRAAAAARARAPRPTSVPRPLAPSRRTTARVSGSSRAREARWVWGRCEHGARASLVAEQRGRHRKTSS